VDPDEEE
jgi:hypothetical protein